MALLAVGIFGACTIWIKFSKAKVYSLLIFGSKASFCIYLVHMFFLNIFSTVGFTVEILTVYHFNTSDCYCKSYMQCLRIFGFIQNPGCEKMAYLGSFKI